MTIAVDPAPLPEIVTIGVLALQGAFIEHIHYLQRLRPKGHTIRAIPVRTAQELQTVQALVIPGGESTVISSIASSPSNPGLLPALLDFVRDENKAVWGTCAGMILMAEEDGVGGGRKKPVKAWGGIRGMKVWRNLYGAQLDSFEAPLIIPALSSPNQPFNAIFIRAPAIHSLSPSSSSSSTTTGETQSQLDMEVLAVLPPNQRASASPSDTPLGPCNEDDLGKVMLRQGKNMVTSFHPELSGDVRVHEYWVEKCVLGR